MFFLICCLSFIGYNSDAYLIQESIDRLGDRIEAIERKKENEAYFRELCEVAAEAERKREEAEYIRKLEEQLEEQRQKKVQEIFMRALKERQDAEWEEIERRERQKKKRQNDR